MEAAGIIYSKQKSFLVFLLLEIVGAMVQGQRTRVGFYSRTCPPAEFIVRSTVEFHHRLNPSVAPALVRMHFHDCFVRGCDASILIDGPNTENTASPNLGVRGYEVIHDAKSQLEAECPGIVSCADIIALAARDSVVLANGPYWQVPTGRRDGRVSFASDTVTLIGTRESVDSQKRKFAAFGLNTLDLVTLVGAHTIGTAACSFFSYRLYNFTTATGNIAADVSLNPAFVSQLRAICPLGSDGTRRAALDMGSGNSFDTSYFKNLVNGLGILESDHQLLTDVSTRSIVQRFLGVRGMRPLNFNVEFGRSMVKMSNIGVKTGFNGEIRRICSAIN